MIETGLKDKVVIVTGAAGGIGRATARRFAREGCRVAVWDTKDDSSAEQVRELAAEGGEAISRRTNVADSADVESATAEVVDCWGRVDVLINNAAINRDGQLVKWKDGAVAEWMSDEALDSVLAVNLRGVFMCARAVAPHMIRQRSGVILNASSVVGTFGNFGVSAYAAAKAGVVGFVRTWSRELGRYNVRVNAVAPGFVDTEMTRVLPQKVLDSMVGSTPLGRMGTVEEIAEAYLWLASDAASFIHGSVLAIDGGLVPGT